MRIEDIASQISIIINAQHDWRDPITGVYVSPGSAEKLVRKSGIANHHLTTYSLSNIFAENYKNWLMCFKIIVWYISVIFETQCRFMVPVED